MGLGTDGWLRYPMNYSSWKFTLVTGFISVEGLRDFAAVFASVLRLPYDLPST